MRKSYVVKETRLLCNKRLLQTSNSTLSWLLKVEDVVHPYKMKILTQNKAIQLTNMTCPARIQMREPGSGPP